MKNSKLTEKQIKLKKAPGADNITNEILKTCLKANPSPFLDVFNSCLQKNEFPEIWKTAKLILIEKPKKKKEDETTYRPLCLSSSVGKLFERIINGRLQKELDEKEILSERQFGYRRGRGTVDAIMSIISDNDENKKSHSRIEGFKL